MYFGPKMQTEECKDKKNAKVSYFVLCCCFIRFLGTYHQPNQAFAESLEESTLSCRLETLSAIHKRAGVVGIAVISDCALDQSKI